MADLTPEQEAALRAPFDAALIDYRPQGKSFTRNGELQGRVVAYVDARAVAARLDAVFGPLNWAYDYDVLITGGGKKHDEVVVVRGRLTICGVTKCDLGDAGDTEASKSAVSDGLKRAAVLWGIGRDLYDLDIEYVKAEGDDFNWRPVKGELERLRAKLRGHAAPVPAKPVRPTAVPSTAAVTWDQTPRIGKADQDAIRTAVAALGWGKRDCLTYLAAYKVGSFSALTAADGAKVAADLTAQAAAVQRPAMTDAESGEAP